MLRFKRSLIGATFLALAMTTLSMHSAVGAAQPSPETTVIETGANLLRAVSTTENWDYVQPWADKENRPLLSDGGDRLVVAVRRVVGLPWSVGQTVTLHEGVTYTVHLRLRATDAAHTVVLDTTQALPVGYENCGLYEPLRVETKWKSFTFSFTAQNTGSGKCAIGLWTGSQCGVFEIAEATLIEASATSHNPSTLPINTSSSPHVNLLLPWADTNSWMVHADHWDYAYHVASENHVLRVDVQDVAESKNTNALQFFQMGGTLEEGRTYTLRFMARASAPRTFGVAVTTDTGTIHPVGLSETAAAGVTWQMFRYTFKAQGADNAHLRLPCFLIGNTKGTLWLANITLEAEPK